MEGKQEGDSEREEEEGGGAWGKQQVFPGSGANMEEKAE